jgi:glucose/mannose-6-phosphate isomerase
MGMLESIKKYPKMCLEAIKLVEKTNIPVYRFNKIMICGMGGSTVGGDLLKDLLRNEIPVLIEVSNQYELPAYVDKNTLVFCVSYSGNTEETLSQFVDAVKRKYKIITITSGGKLKKWCEKLSIPLIKLPEGYQPRATLPYQFFIMLACLQKFKLINNRKEIKETIQVLNSIKTDDFKEIPLSLKDSYPVIYGFGVFSNVAKRLKNQFNENSKVPARYAVFPELNHNEIVGYENEYLNKNSFIIILRDKDESKEIKIRIETTKELIKDKVKGMKDIYAVGKSKLAKMMSLLFIGDYLSYELAVLNKVDAEKTENIAILKKNLKEKLNLVEKLEKRLNF